MRLIFSLLLAFSLLSSCAGRPGADVLQAINTKTTDTKIVTAYVASTREKNNEAKKGFGAGRAAELNYARFDISIPPSHKSGNIEWSKGKPNPSKDFVVTKADMLTKTRFNSDLGDVTRSGKQIALFVHGYNYSYQEALFRAAQMAADANMDGVPLVFSWPSQASVTGYVADKESATYSRDALAMVLTDLTRQTPKKALSCSVTAWAAGWSWKRCDNCASKAGTMCSPNYRWCWPRRISTPMFFASRSRWWEGSIRRSPFSSPRTTAP